MTITSDVYEYLTADNARQDKVEINIGNWTVDSIDTEMIGFINYLGSDEAHERRQIYRAFQHDGRVLPITRSYNLKILSARRRRISVPMAPLFAGHLNIRRVSGSDTTDRYVLSLKLSINPTRFCVYQETPTRISVTERALSNRAVLFATQDLCSYKGESALDNKDNVLLRPSSHLNANGQFWESNFRRYLSEIVCYFEDELSSYQSGGFALLGYDEIYTVRRVENYWDYPVRDAVGFVKALETTFTTLANDSSTSTYSDASSAHDGSSLCLRGQFRNGEKLKVYAKTGQRVRIEVEHRYNQNSSLAPERSYTRSNLDELFGFFHEGQIAATSLVREFWQTISRYSSLSDLGGGSALFFIRELFAVVGDIDEAGEILSLLVTQGGIPTRKLSDNRKAALADLVSIGLLERHGRPNTRYVVAPRFHSAVGQLS